MGASCRGSRGEPTRHPDPTPPTRHPDPTPRPPDTQREVSGLQSDARGCKGGKAYARGRKGMQAKKQGGRGQGVGARGKGVANLAKRRKRKKPWRFQRGVFICRGLMRQGSFALLARLLPPAPLTPPPCSLPPCFCGCISFAFPSHYGFSSPSHSPCIRFSSPPPPFACRGVGVSGRGVGSGVSGRGVGSALPCSPCSLPPLALRDRPPPPLAPPPRGSGGYKLCAHLAFARWAFINHPTYAVGLLLSDCLDTSLCSGM